MSQFFKIVLKANAMQLGETAKGKKRRKTIYLSGTRRENGSFYGRAVDRETLEDKSWIDAKGVIHDQMEWIHGSAVETWTEMYEDLFYGGLTFKTREEQTKERQATYKRLGISND